jgi:flagellar basal-body rod modification protein FlgD
MSTIETGYSPSLFGGDAKASAFSELSAEQFTRIMFTELSRQDPMAPSDSKDLLQQLSSLRAIQSDMEMGRRLESLVMQNELSAASTLIGRRVSGVDWRLERVEDVVVSVSRTAGGAVLNLRGGARVNMANLDQVQEEESP